jgi:NAD dependent epimerase/dehydratase family enzyme
MTQDSRVVPKRLLDKGFEFVLPTIEQAVAHLTVNQDEKN